MLSPNYKPGNQKCSFQGLQKKLLLMLKFNSKNGLKLYHLNICSLYSQIVEI